MPCLALRRCHLYSVSCIVSVTFHRPHACYHGQRKSDWPPVAPSPCSPPPPSYLSLSLLVLPFGGGDKLSRALGRLKSKTEPNCGYRWTNNEFCHARLFAHHKNTWFFFFIFFYLHRHGGSFELCFICIFVWVLRQFCLFWNSRRPYLEFTVKVKVRGF